MSGVVAVGVVLIFYGFFIFRLYSDLILFGCCAVTLISEFEKELNLVIQRALSYSGCSFRE
jgi:hypothetical protein